MPTLTRRSTLAPRDSDLRAKPPIDMKRVATIILGGGQGSRLFPLTKWLCKPALSYGGRYRLIDVPISNAINSGCDKIYIITQFLSSSLHQHVFNTYRLSSFSSGFIELLPAEERHHNKTWFQGTADAVRQNLDYFINTPADYFLILSGDQLYNMDFQDMLQFARKTDADLVIASLPITEPDAKRMGVLQTDADDLILSFKEKPQSDQELDSMRLSSPIGCNNKRAPLEFLGSMGIYLFKREALIDLLTEDPREDFGKHLIPTQVAKGKTSAYIYEGYWEDIGTIESFYYANMALTDAEPQFDCYNEEKRIFTSPTNLPGAKISNTLVKSAILCEGAYIEADEITHSIIGPRSVIKNGSIIRDSYLMGNDFYRPQMHSSNLPETFQIGQNCIIRKAIIDKHVYIGDGVQLINKNKLTTYDSDIAYIRNGVIVIPRGATIPDGFIL